MSTEVIESFNTFSFVSITTNHYIVSVHQIIVNVNKYLSIFLQEILLAFHLSVGSTDTVDVKQKIFEDIIDLSRHLQVRCILRIKTINAGTCLKRCKGFRK